MDVVPSSPFVRGGRGRLQTTAYQWLTGTTLPSLRQRLAPDPEDWREIVLRVDFYRKHMPWVNRGLVIRAGLNAAEFRIDAPGAPDQQEWMLGLKRRLRMFSLMREFFWELRAFGQVILLWKTGRGGRDPISLECANPLIFQPRFNPLDGSRPRIVILPGMDERLRTLVGDAQSAESTKRAAAERALSAYPPPLVEAVRSARPETAEVPAEDLERYGYHFEYAALDRRHWEDWGFPGMYSIFPYLEMLMLADDADINALHHYKAGILLVRIGPSEPRAGDEALLPRETEVKAVEAKLVEMAKARLPHWAARGDLRIDWVVPPEHIMNPAKVASAQEKVFDWLGIPKPAWPGQGLQGAFASALVTLKFLQQESKDERALAKELFESWFYERCKATNRFQGAVWPVVRFDPNALLEPRVILELARLYMQYGGADEQTIAEMFDYDAEVWLARRQETERLKQRYGVDFRPEFTPSVFAGRSAGRPATVDQPTPEQTAPGQPRPSTSEAERAAQVAEQEFGLDAEAFRQALEGMG
jgi:hypothetical protein